MTPVAICCIGHAIWWRITPGIGSMKRRTQTTGAKRVTGSTPVKVSPTPSSASSAPACHATWTPAVNPHQLAIHPTAITPTAARLGCSGTWRSRLRRSHASHAATSGARKMCDCSSSRRPIANMSSSG